jgi:1-pyrroline-5-carboxylate dehydrogenase
MATLELPVRPPRTSTHQGPFINEPFFDFTKEDNARKMRAAIERVRGQLGREYDLIIGGQRVKTADKIKSLNPAKPSQIVGIHQKAGKEHVQPAMTAALKAFDSWKYTPIEERAALLFRTADLLRERKMDQMAWLVFEVSKNWGEADADISEAIDFCEFYAREALRFAKAEPPVQMPGERDTLAYIPLGVGAVIPRKRQHRNPEAVERFPHYRREIRRAPRRSRHARGRSELLPRRRRQLRRCRSRSS